MATSKSRQRKPQVIKKDEPAKAFEDEEDTPHEGMHGSVVQLTDHEKPVRVKKKPKIGFY
jgi:hypothetical protein